MMINLWFTHITRDVPEKLASRNSKRYLHPCFKSLSDLEVQSLVELDGPFIDRALLIAFFVSNLPNLKYINIGGKCLGIANDNFCSIQPLFYSLPPRSSFALKRLVIQNRCDVSPIEINFLKRHFLHLEEVHAEFRNTFWNTETCTGTHIMAETDKVDQIVPQLMRMVSILLLVLSACSANLLDAKYEIVNGVPYNKDAPRNENYPYCPRDGLIELEPGNDLTEDFINCTCSHPDDDFLPSFVCSGLPNITYLEAYFNRLFPTYLASRITVSSSTLVRIPADVFSDKQPKVVTWYNNRLTEIHPEAFRLTRPRLEVLEIDYEPELVYFPFTSLNEFPALTELRINNNELKNISELADLSVPGLQLLNLDNNVIETEFPKLRFLPKLRVLTARNSLIPSISTELPFEELQSLEVINLNGNNLESIQAGSFVFDQQTEIRTIDLGSCKISSVEEGAFVGLLDSTELRLENNKLTTFPEDAFRETIETMISGSGKIYLEGNLITCCCDVNWIVSNIPLQVPLVGATCAGKVLLTQLPPDYLNPLCPPTSI